MKTKQISFWVPFSVPKYLEAAVRSNEFCNRHLSASMLSMDITSLSILSIHVVIMVFIPSTLLDKSRFRYKPLR